MRRAPSGFSLPRGGCGSIPVLLLDGATRGVAWEQHKPGERPGERRSDGGLVTTECGGLGLRLGGRAAWRGPYLPSPGLGGGPGGACAVPTRRFVEGEVCRGHR